MTIDVKRKLAIFNKTKPIKGYCEICQKSRPLFKDHNHETGIYRGRLCHQCNSGLGMFKDSKHLLKLAVNYLSERGNYSKVAKNPKLPRKSLNLEDLPESEKAILVTR